MTHDANKRIGTAQADVPTELLRSELEAIAGGTGSGTGTSRVLLGLRKSAGNQASGAMFLY